MHHTHREFFDLQLARFAIAESGSMSTLTYWVISGLSLLWQTLNQGSPLAGDNVRKDSRTKKEVRHMTSDFAKNVGLAHKVISAGERVGFTPAQWNALAENPTLFDAIHDVVLGHSEIKPIEHLIDCDANPFNPWANNGFTIEEHQKGGQWKFDPKQVEFFLSSGQKDGKVIEGNKLRKELVKKPVMNANVLDYLLAHPELIPDEWKTDGNGNTRYIFFWGTGYRDRGGRLCVRCLYWDGGGWRWSFYWLDYGWFGDDPAAVRAS